MTAKKKKAAPASGGNKEVAKLKSEIAALNKENAALNKVGSKIDSKLADADERFEADKAVIFDLKESLKGYDTLVGHNERLREQIEDLSKSLHEAKDEYADLKRYPIKEYRVMPVPNLGNKSRVLKACESIMKNDDCEHVLNIVRGIKRFVERRCK